MTRLTLLLLAACNIESGINKTPEEPVFSDDDTGDTQPDTDTDTDTDSGEPDTAPACDDQSFAATPVLRVAECVDGLPVGTFNPVIEWENTDYVAMAGAPVVGQLTDDDGDGAITDADLPDVVVTDDDGFFWAIAGDGTTLWHVRGPGLATPAIGDLDGDGFPEVVAAGYGSTMAVRGTDGSTFWSGPGIAGGGVYGAVALADLEGDGTVEVIAGGAILEGATGRLRGVGAHGIGTGFEEDSCCAIGTAADIDRDGVLEVVVGNALYDPTGATIWYNGESDGYVAVADFDGDPEGEIVVTRGGDLRLQDSNGTVLWRLNLDPWSAGPATVADLDGDGVPEIGVATMAEYVVLDADGRRVWSRPTHDVTSGFTGASIFDFEGDGALEIIYADEQDVWVFDGATGAVKLQEPTHASITGLEYPVIADVDGDGHAEIVYTSNPWGGGTERGVRVIGDADDSWQPARRTWNQYSYSITNVEDDDGIPATPDVNWDTWNSFRAANLDVSSAVPDGVPDLYPYVHAVCVDECAEGRVTAWISIGNQGLVDVTAPFDVEIRGVGEAGEVLVHAFTWTATVNAGELSYADSVEFSVPGPLTALVVTVDAGAAVNECDEANNETTWAGSICP